MSQMRRRPRPPQTTPVPQELLAPETGRPGAGGGAVQVIWGAMQESLDLAEMTVEEAYRLLRAPFNIAPAVAALVNGAPAGPEDRLSLGDTLEFARPAGEKGVGR